MLTQTDRHRLSIDRPKMQYIYHFQNLGSVQFTSQHAFQFSKLNIFKIINNNLQQLNLPFQFNYVLCFKPNCIQMEKGNMAFMSHVCVFFFNHLFIISQSGIYAISTEQYCTFDNCLLPYYTFWSINRRIVIQVSLSVKTRGLPTFFFTFTHRY